VRGVRSCRAHVWKCVSHFTLVCHVTLKSSVWHDTCTWHQDCVWGVRGYRTHVRQCHTDTHECGTTRTRSSLTRTTVAEIYAYYTSSLSLPHTHTHTHTHVTTPPTTNRPLPGYIWKKESTRKEDSHLSPTLRQTYDVPPTPPPHLPHTNVRRWRWRLHRYIPWVINLRPARLCVCVCMHAYVRAYARACVRACVCVCMCACVRSCVRAWVFACIFLYVSLVCESMYSHTRLTYVLTYKTHICTHIQDSHMYTREYTWVAKSSISELLAILTSFGFECRVGVDVHIPI